MKKTFRYDNDYRRVDVELSIADAPETITLINCKLSFLRTDGETDEW